MEVSCQVSNRSFDPGYRRVILKRQGEDYIPFRGQGYFLDTRWPTTEFPARNFPKPGESIFAQKFPLREDGHSRTLWRRGKSKKKSGQSMTRCEIEANYRAEELFIFSFFF